MGHIYVHKNPVITNHLVEGDNKRDSYYTCIMYVSANHYKTLIFLPAGSRIRHNGEFALSGFVITGLPCTFI